MTELLNKVCKERKTQKTKQKSGQDKQKTRKYKKQTKKSSKETRIKQNKTKERREKNKREKKLPSQPNPYFRMIFSQWKLLVSSSKSQRKLFMLLKSFYLLGTIFCKSNCFP